MRYLFALSFLVLLSACKKEFISPEVKSLYESVMAVHDEVMPEMSTINKLKRGIRKVDGSSQKSLQMLTQLEDADEGMMSWMHEFKLDRNTTEIVQKTYLEAEQKRIDKVSVDMKTAISKAKEYLKSIQK